MVKVFKTTKYINENFIGSSHGILLHLSDKCNEKTSFPFTELMIEYD